MKLSQSMDLIKLSSHREEIIQDLQAHKLNEPDGEGKTSILSKDKIKKMIGRSPDYSDMLMMKQIFHIKKARQKTTIH